MIATNTNALRDGFVDIRILVPAGQAVDIGCDTTGIVIASSPDIHLRDRSVVSGSVASSPTNAPSQKEPARELRRTPLPRRL